MPPGFRQIGLLASIALWPLAASAQDVGEGGGDTGNAAPDSPPIAAPDAEGRTVVQSTITPPTTETTTTYTPPYGFPAPGPDPNAHLPSSSRPITDTTTSADGFDLLEGESRAGTVYGDKEGAVVLGRRGGAVPSIHSVKRGDTLWDLSATYFNNPWLWPKVWSYNPQLKNPHWIYPGDQLRMREEGGYGASVSLAPGMMGPSAIQSGLVNRRPLVPPQTVFTRNLGYIDDPAKDVLGELVGAPEEQMLLSEGNDVYVKLRPGLEPRPGQRLTIFRSVRPPEDVKGARKPPGEIVAVKGSIRIDQWNPKTRVARGRIVESLDIIERGDKLGAAGTRFDVVPPVQNSAQVSARVLTSFYPHEIMGQYQVAFIDKGAKDGLRAGNRLLVVERGDAWRKSLRTASSMARTRVRTDVPERVKVEETPLNGKDEEFPEEVVGELRILRTKDYTSLALVTESQREIEPGDRVVARRGY